MIEIHGGIDCYAPPGTSRGLLLISLVIRTTLTAVSILRGCRLHFLA